MSAAAIAASVAASNAAIAAANSANIAASMLHMSEAPAPERFGAVACAVIVIGLVVFGRIIYYCVTESNAWRRLIWWGKERKALARSAARTKERAARWGSSK